jgi:hypothetical protein
MKRTIILLTALAFFATASMAFARDYGREVLMQTYNEQYAAQVKAAQKDKAPAATSSKSELIKATSAKVKKAK